MGIIFKQSLKGTAYSYMGTALGFILTGLMMPNIFSTDEIGLLRVLVSYGTLFAQFANLGLNSVTVKLFPFFRDEKQKHHGFLGFIILIGLTGVILSTLFFLIIMPLLVDYNQDKSVLFTTYAYYVLPLILFTLLFNLFDTYYRVLYNAVKGIFYKEIIQRVFLLVVILTFYYGYIDFKETVILYIIGNILPSIILLFTIIRDKLFFIIPSPLLFKRKFLGNFFNVAFYGLINSFSGVLALNIDILMISFFIGLSATGIYTTTFFFGAFTIMPFRSLSKISSVIIADAWGKNDLKTIRDIYQKSSITLTMIGLLILTGIWGNIDNIFHILKPVFLEGKYVILIIGLAYVLDMVIGVAKSIIFNSSYYRIFSVYLIIYIVSLILFNFLLIPIYGIIGAAIATLISKLLFNMIIASHMYIRHRMIIFNYRLLLLFFFAFIAYLLSTLMPPLNNFIIDIIVRSAIISILYLVPVIGLNISPDVNHNLRKQIDYFIHRK